MDVQDIRLVVQAMEARPSDTPSLLPGTISEVSEDGSTAILVMDSDPDGITVQARMLFADLGEGDRAMVMFDPPRGVYVVGTIGRRAEAGMIIVAYEDTTTITIEGGTNTYTETLVLDPIQFMVKGDRRYRLDLKQSFIWGYDDSFFPVASMWLQTQIESTYGLFTSGNAQNLTTQTLYYDGVYFPYTHIDDFGVIRYGENNFDKLSIYITINLIDAFGEDIPEFDLTFYTQIFITDAGPV